MENIVKPELLSPVGSPETLIAAVENGANAVYLGGKNFSARQYASNFTDEELKKAVEYCHLQGVKVYVTINTLLKEAELKKVIDYIIFLYKINVDALIIQDLGLLKILQEINIDFPLQSSTQMTIHSLQGVNFLEEEGFYRAVLARELSIKEIQDITSKSNIEIKIFNHGALCISYSGQCLMSSIIGGRSGNRGRCAQPCRKKYKLVDLINHKELESKKSFLLSPKDLNTIQDIKEIVDTGVHSFKIEGRMKRPEYVAIVTALYRKAINQYIIENKVEQDKEDLKDLEQIFNRGFTSGYLFSNPGEKIISKDKPNHRGIYLGKIHSINKHKSKMDILVEEPLRKGDGIEIPTSEKDSVGMFVPYLEIKNKDIQEVKAGQKVTTLLLKNAKVGDKVYKTSDISLMKKARDTYKTLYNTKIKINGKISVIKGQPLHIHIWNKENKRVSVKGETLVESAINKPLDQNRINQQLNKLGGTPYEFENIEIDLDENASIPMKEINAVRREAIDRLKEKVLENDRSDIKVRDIKDKFHNLWRPVEQEKIETKLSAKVNNIAGVEALAKTNVSEIIFGGDIDLNIDSYYRAAEIAKSNNKAIVFSFPRIVKENYISLLDQRKHDLIQINPDGLLLSNLELVQYFRDTEIPKEGDFSLNPFNHLAIKKLQEMGLESTCISPELSLKEIKEIKKFTNIPLNIFIHGDIEMMLSEYCPVSCRDRNDSCFSCKNNFRYGLKDEKGLVFPLYIDAFGRSHILNSKKLCLLENLKDIHKIGFKNLRLQFLMESEQEIIQTASAYSDYLDNLKAGNYNMPVDTIDLLEKFKNQGLTKGHYYRGVL